MKDIKKGANAIAAVICRICDYHVARQALSVAKENGFDETTTEHADLVNDCVTAEHGIADAIEAIAKEVQ